MECSRCRHQSPEAARFCVQCHAPLRYVCPACKQLQREGGKCEKCGVDFVKYAMAFQLQMRSQAQQDHARSKTPLSTLKQVLLLPVTGGLSLVGFLRSRLRSE